MTTFVYLTVAFWGSEKEKNFSPKEKKESQKKRAKIVLKNKIEPAVVQICGENKNQVEDAEKWLKNAILKEQCEREITDESILHFGEAQSEELNKLQEELKVAIDLERTVIRISGIGKDVLMAYLSIQEMIHMVKVAEQEEKSAKLLQNIIEWKYQKDDSYVRFDVLTNKRLEDAFQQQQKAVAVTIDGKTYIVNIKMKCAVNEKENVIPITRVDKSEGKQKHLDRLTFLCCWG